MLPIKFNLNQYLIVVNTPQAFCFETQRPFGYASQAMSSRTKAAAGCLFAE
jgi:hypothetical protein